MLLETKRLYVRHLQLNDAIRMCEYRNKEEVARYQSWVSYSMQEAKKRIVHCMQMTSWNQPKDNYHLAIVLKENNLMIGDLFVEIVTKKVFILGYTLDSYYWSQGYASEVVSAFCQYMKEVYRFKKVICYVYHDNIRSKKLLERLHFMKFDESYYYDDEGYIKKLK